MEPVSTLRIHVYEGWWTTCSPASQETGTGGLLEPPSLRSAWAAQQDPISRKNTRVCEKLKVQKYSLFLNYLLWIVIHIFQNIEYRVKKLSYCDLIPLPHRYIPYQSFEYPGNFSAKKIIIFLKSSVFYLVFCKLAYASRTFLMFLSMLTGTLFF